MLNITKIRENKQKFIDLLKIKNFEGSDLIACALTKDDERKLIKMYRKYKKELKSDLNLRYTLIANQNIK